MLQDASSATKSQGPARSPGTLWTTAEDLFGALHRRSDEPPGDIHGGAGEHQAPDRPRMTHGSGPLVGARRMAARRRHLGHSPS